MASAKVDNYDLFEVDETKTVFAAEDESFVGIMSDTSEIMKGDIQELFSDKTAEFRDRLKASESFTFQSEDKLTRSKNGKVEIVKARILLKSGSKTYVLNEEHRFLGENSYALFMFSELNKEYLALKASERIGATFTDSSDEKYSHWSPRRLLLGAFVSTADAREVARSRGSVSAPANRTAPTNASRVRDPRCMNVGIEDRNDIRFLNEQRPSMTSFANAGDCGAGGKEAWDSLVASLTGPSNWLVALGVDEDQQRLVRLNPVAGTGVEAIKALEGIYGLVATVGSTIADKKLGVFSYLLQEVRNDDRRTNCMTNAAQMRQVCRRLAKIAPALIARRPLGVAVRGGTRVAATAVRAPRAALGRAATATRERAGALLGRTTLERTTNQLVNGRVRMRDGGFRGSIINTPPTAGRYTIVNTRSISRGQTRDQLTLIESSDGVGPGATLRRIKADNEDYIPGHRTSVGEVTIGPNGEVTLRAHPKTGAGDLEILQRQLRERGIRAR